MPKKITLTRDQVETIIAMRKQGCKWVEIARVVGAPNTTCKSVYLRECDPEQEKIEQEKRRQWNLRQKARNEYNEYEGADWRPVLFAINATSVWRSSL